MTQGSNKQSINQSC